MARRVEQHSASDDPVVGPVSDPDALALEVVVLEPLVVAVPAIADVPQPVPLARPLQLEAVERVVPPAAGYLLVVGVRRSVGEERRRRLVHREAQVDDAARPDQRGGLTDALGGEVTHRAEVVAGTEHAPGVSLLLALELRKLRVPGEFTAHAVTSRGCAPSEG